MKTFIFSALLCLSLGAVMLSAQGVSLNTSGNPPDNSALLDVEASDKGLLIPRVALVSPTSPISSPATSLLVYNTSTTGTYDTPGFYYFDGTDWVCISCGSAPTNNSRVFFRHLTSSVTNTVTTSSAGITTLFNFNYTPINDTIFLQVNVA